MNFRIYKHRSAAQVKVPLATPEVIELNEITTAPFSIHEYYETASPILENNCDDLINSSSSIIPESIADSSKQTRGTNQFFFSRESSRFFSPLI